MPAAAVILLGCPKNQFDTEYVLGALVRAGFELVTSPARADVIVITTCAFLGSAVQEAETAIATALTVKRQRPEVKIVVAGCLVQRYGAALAERFPAVDLWVGVDGLGRIPRLLGRRGLYSAGEPRLLLPAGGSRVLSTPRHYAWLKIADGCDNRCSYCLIPGLRGRRRSRSLRSIVAEARGLVRLGVRELVLVAQDTAAWGRDLAGAPDIARLLARLGRLSGLGWLRLMYAHPAHVSDRLIAEFGHNPKLCRYLDLPVQHCSDRILRAMNRHHRRADLERLLEKLRRVPDLQLRTTIIVGFPGEGEREFRELTEFVRTVQFERLSVYAFSAEPSTAAAGMKGQVPESVKRERVRELMKLQAAVSRNHRRRLLGKELLVLVDRPGIARTEWDAPEVDGVVRLKGRPVAPGRFVRCRVTGATTHDLVATVPAGSSVRREADGMCVDTRVVADRIGP